MYKVLVVEDEDLIRKGIILTVDWNSIGCVVVGEAANGEAGIAAVEKFSPDIIITDLNMPGMDGIEMLTKLREGGCNAFVIVLTAYDSFKYAQSALRLGAVDFILKPFHDGELENAILSIQEKNRKDDDPASAVFSVKKGDKSRYVMAAMEYIDKHYGDENLSIAVVGEAIGISEGHLSHIFKKETDYTPNAYITRFRMHKAMQMLSDVAVKVYEVAERVGYKDIAYFSSTFKKVVGVTPSEYQSGKY